MGTGRSADRSGVPVTGRSIGRQLSTRVIAPVVCLVVLWGLLTAGALTGELDKLRWPRSISSSHRLLIEAAVVAGLGLVIILVVVLLLRSFAKRLSRELSGLAAAARLADERLPAIVERLRSGELSAGNATLPPLPATNTSEVAAAAAAVASMHHAALTATTAEAGLRNGLRRILVSLAKRNQALLHRQLRIIDELEQQAASPAALADLFTLDHLTTRMRRNAESLTILSGAVPGRSWSGPVPVVDVLRAAAAEVEDYTRVTIISDSDDSVAASAVTDLIHLMAELIENATLFSPSSTRVEVRADRVANGFAIEVEDRGLGIPPDQLREVNERLADPPELDHADPDQLGLFVAGTLAARYGALISLCPSPYRGIKAVVLLPDSIMVAAADTSDPVSVATGLAGGAARLNLQAPGVLSLTGALTGAPSAAPAGDGPAQPAVTTLNGLPRRTRPGASLTQPPKREARDDEPRTPLRRVPVSGPAPEEARTLAASLQSSWQRSRQSDPNASETGQRETATTDDSASGDGSACEEALWWLAAPRRETWPGYSMILLTASPTSGGR
ncbi:MAG TPA: ATP-binding protein [Streptosporangiaceae bacterium]|nr:ATP-binding protein [Streptosporangiaceae bacterium]